MGIGLAHGAAEVAGVAAMLDPRVRAMVMVAMAMAIIRNGCLPMDGDGW